MPAALPLSSDYRYRPSLRSRFAALLLTLGMFALFIAILLTMAALMPGGGEKGGTLVAVNVASQNQSETKSPQKHTVARKVQASQPVSVTVPQPPQPVVKPVPQLNLIRLSREEFAAADISKLGRRRPDAADQGEAGPSGGGAAGPGEGPGGAHLYNAAWYREPTHAELSPYLPHGAPPGSWATIACRTIDHYHVEDCQELAESPPGSGLSRALRQAGWQFLVRPPRIDGKPMLGTWVRIRFDFTRAPAGEQEADGPISAR